MSGKGKGKSKKKLGLSVAKKLAENNIQRKRERAVLKKTKNAPISLKDIISVAFGAPPLVSIGKSEDIKNLVDIVEGEPTPVTINPAVNTLFSSAAAGTAEKRTAFNVLRAKAVLADLVHDFGKKYLNLVFGITASIAMGGGGAGGPHPVIQLIQRITAHLGPLPDPILTELLNFYNNCSNDATAKKLYTETLNAYLSQYENINSFEVFTDKEYDNDGGEETLSFFRRLLELTAGRKISFYLDAQFGNVLEEYRKIKTQLGQISLDNFLIDVAYIIDPASGWNPRGTYDTIINPNNLRFSPEYTGLGHTLELVYINEKTVDATWIDAANVRSETIRVSNATTSVNETAATCMGLKPSRAEGDGNNDGSAIDYRPERWAPLLNNFLPKSGGDVCQGNSASSDTTWTRVWSVGEIVIIVTNDYLALIYYLLYKRAWVLFTGTGYYKLYAPTELSAVLDAGQIASIAIFLQSKLPTNALAQGTLPWFPEFPLVPSPALPAGTNLSQLNNIQTVIQNYYSNILVLAKSHIDHLVNLYISNRAPIYNRRALVAGTIDSNVIITSDTEMYECTDRPIDTTLPNSLTFLCDILEKFYILDTMKDKVRNNIFADFNPSSGSISRKHFPLTSISEFKKYMGIYGIYSKKANYNKLAAALSSFVRDITTPVSLSTTLIILNSAHPRLLIFRELCRLLSGVIKNPMVSASTIAFALTYQIYLVTRPADPGDREPRLPIEKERLIARRRENINRDAWLLKYMGLFNMFFGAAGAAAGAQTVASLIHSNNVAAQLQLVLNIVRKIINDPTLFNNGIDIDLSTFPAELQTDNILEEGALGIELYRKHLEELKAARELPFGRATVTLPDGVAHKIRGRTKGKGTPTLQIQKGGEIVGEGEGEGEEEDEDEEVNELLSKYDVDNPITHPDYSEVLKTFEHIDTLLDEDDSEKHERNDDEIVATLIADCILCAASLDAKSEGLDVLGAIGRYKERFETEYDKTPLKEIASELFNHYSIRGIRDTFLYRLDELKERIGIIESASAETTTAATTSSTNLSTTADMPAAAPLTETVTPSTNLSTPAPSETVTPSAAAAKISEFSAKLNALKFSIDNAKDNKELQTYRSPLTQLKKTFEKYVKEKFGDVDYYDKDEEIISIEDEIDALFDKISTRGASFSASVSMKSGLGPGSVISAVPPPGVERQAGLVSNGGARTARRRHRQRSPTRRRNNRRKVTRRRKAPNLLRRLRGTRRFRSDR